MGLIVFLCKLSSNFDITVNHFEANVLKPSLFYIHPNKNSDALRLGGPSWYFYQCVHKHTKCCISNILDLILSCGTDIFCSGLRLLPNCFFMNSETNLKTWNSGYWWKKITMLQHFKLPFDISLLQNWGVICHLTKFYTQTFHFITAWSP